MSNRGGATSRQENPYPAYCTISPALPCLVPGRGWRSCSPPTSPLCAEIPIGAATPPGSGPRPRLCHPEPSGAIQRLAAAARVCPRAPAIFFPLPAKPELAGIGMNARTGCKAGSAGVPIGGSPRPQDLSQALRTEPPESRDPPTALRRRRHPHPQDGGRPGTLPARPAQRGTPGSNASSGVRAGSRVRPEPRGLHAVSVGRSRGSAGPGRGVGGCATIVPWKDQRDLAKAGCCTPDPREDAGSPGRAN